MPSVQPILDEGDVASFVFLHLETASYIKPHETKEKHSRYDVEGKARPMIVITREGQPTRPHKCWYHVLPLTTKGMREDGGMKARHVPVGLLAGDREESCAILELHRYPAQLIQPQGRVSKLGRETVDALTRLLAVQGLRGPTFGGPTDR